MKRNQVFITRKNRVCVCIKGCGFVPVASTGDDVPVFETEPPIRVGEDAIVFVEGKRRRVRLLPQLWAENNALWLVDMGPA